MSQLMVVGHCSACGAPIYGPEKADSPKVVYTCRVKCPMAVRTPPEKGEKGS